jgi:hypothetical protein
MSNKFLTSTKTQNIANSDSVPSLGIDSLIPGLPIKTSSSKELYSTKLLVDDLFEADQIVLNPYNAKFQADDVEIKYNTTPILLSDYLDTNNNNIIALQDSDNNLQTQITANDGEILTLQNEDINLQTQITANDGEILALQNEDINLQTQITANDNDISDLQTQITANDNDITTLSDELTSGLALKLDKVATTPLDMNSNDITNVNSIYLTGTDTIFENGVVRPKIYTEDNGNTTNSTAVGKDAGNVGVVTGAQNSAFGERSLEKITSGGANTAMGYSTMVNLTTGLSNTSVGYNSMYFTTSSNNNTCIGANSGTNLTTGENNTCIGYNARTGTGNAQNRIIIGKDATGTTDNECVIGNTSLTSIRAGGINCDLGTTSVRFKDIYLSGTVNANAVVLPGGDVQTQIDNATSGTTSGLGLKMDKIATTPLEMSGFAITNVSSIGVTGAITTNTLQMGDGTVGHVKPSLSDVADLGLANRRYRNAFLSEAIQVPTVDCDTVSCDGNVLTGDLIPKVIQNRDVGKAAQQYRNGYFSGTLDTAAVVLPSGNVQTQLTGLQSQITSNDGEISTLQSNVTALSGSTTTSLDTLNDKTQNITAVLNDTTFAGRVQVPAVIECPLVRNPVNTSTLTLNNDEAILSSNSQSIKVDSTGLVTDDIKVNGAIYTSIVSSLPGSGGLPLVQDDFSGATLKNGAQLIGFGQPGAPFHDVGNSWVQLTTDAVPTVTGYLTYTDPTILSAIQGSSEWYCKFTGFFTDTDTADGQVFFVHQQQSAPSSNAVTAIGYTMLFFSNLGTTLIFYENNIISNQPGQFNPLNPSQNYLIEWKIVKSGPNTTFTCYLDGAPQPNPFTDSVPRTFTTNYVGIGAYTAGTTNFAANYFVRDIEIDTVPSSGVGGGGVSEVGLSGTSLNLTVGATTAVNMTEDSIVLTNGSSTIQLNQGGMFLGNTNGVVIENTLVATNIWPSANNNWDIGYDAIRYKDIYLSGSVKSNAANITGLSTTQKIVPQSNISHDIGETNLRYNNVYVNTLDARYIVKRYVNGWYNLSESVTIMGNALGQWSAIYSGTTNTTTDDITYDSTRMRIFDWDIDPGYYTPRLQYGYNGIFPPQYLTTAVVETAVFEVNICLVLQNATTQQQQIIIAVFKNGDPEAITTNALGLLPQSVAHISVDSNANEPKIFTTTFLVELQNADNLIIRMAPNLSANGDDVSVRGLKWTATQI